jgi:hypothetical protein
MCLQTGKSLKVTCDDGDDDVCCDDDNDDDDDDDGVWCGETQT